jgi:hypothetical protein
MFVAVQVCSPSGFVCDSVDEHEALWIEVELAVEPGPALFQDIGPVLLNRVPGLFLRVMLWRTKKR